jgi:hypothetical protein
LPIAAVEASRLAHSRVVRRALGLINRRVLTRVIGG